MKILIVGNNKSGKFAPFIVEQVDSLRALGVEIEYFGVLCIYWRGTKEIFV